MTGELPVVGVVGLGTMGFPVSQRLIESGVEVHGFDLSEGAVARAVDAGVVAAPSVQVLARHVDVLLLSLPNGEAAVTALAALAELKDSRCTAAVDLSTIGPEAATTIQGVLATADIDYLDAPVSGGPAGARTGRLAVMVAGEAALIDRLDPLLRLLGTKITVVGDTAGQGQLTKVLNNLMSASSIAITAEALVVATKAGLDPNRFLEVINASSGRNAAASDKYPQHVLPRSFDFGFRLQLMRKDVALALDSAKSNAVPMLLGSTVGSLWQVAQSMLDPESDCTEFIRVIESWSAVTVQGDSR